MKEYISKVKSTDRRVMEIHCICGDTVAGVGEGVTFLAEDHRRSDGISLLSFMFKLSPSIKREKALKSPGK